MSWHVAGDWGTTRLRLFRVDDGAVAERLDGPGIGALQDLPSAHLEHLLGQWNSHGRPGHVLLCGMAGARNGLREAPYVPCPVGVADWKAATLCFDFQGKPARIAAGIRLGHEDVMRGEETQIFGALAREPDLMSGKLLFVLPGTHSKWAWVEDGTITGLRTWFTGELFAFLTTQSTLLKARAEVGGEEEGAAGWREGLTRAQQGSGLLGSMFESRAAQLLRGHSATWAEGFLSGLLIGSEIEEGRRRTGLPDRIIMIGAPSLVARYAAAFADHGGAVRVMDGEQCVLAGLELLNNLD